MKYIIYILARLSKALSGNNLLPKIYELYYSIELHGIIAWRSAKDNYLNSLNFKIVKVLVSANPNIRLPLNMMKSIP